MSPTAARPVTTTQTPHFVRDLALIVLLAVVVRLATFNGAFGSDDLNYFSRSTLLAHGDWSSSDYNGSLRYGFNLPAAVLIALFGNSLFVANLWPLSCSLIEIGAVFIFASAAIGRRAGAFAALLLACAPLHIAVATRIHADPVVSMFVTVGFVLLYFGALRRQPMLLFGAGIAIGGIFWAKELVAVTWVAFVPLLWFFRGQWRAVSYVVAGGATMMLLHGVLMFAVAGDPLHLIKVVLVAVKQNFVDGGQGEDSAAYYLRYLFVDLRHTGALGFFAMAAIPLALGWVKVDRCKQRGLVYACLWWVGLLIVLSLFPVSLFPLRLTMKQSNYITLFLAPTAVLAGAAIASLSRTLGKTALVLCLAIGLLLGLLQQADYRSFTANSKALTLFAVEHPDSLVVGSVNNSKLGNFWGRQKFPDAEKATIIDFRAVREKPVDARSRMREANVIFAVIDRQTMRWGDGKTPITAPLQCWHHELTLTPSGLGLGNEFARLLSFALMPVKPLAIALDRLASPQNADVYRVSGSDVLCRLD